MHHMNCYVIHLHLLYIHIIHNYFLVLIYHQYSGIINISVVDLQLMGAMHFGTLPTSLMSSRAFLACWTSRESETSQPTPFIQFRSDLYCFYR